MQTRGSKGVGNSGSMRRERTIGHPGEVNAIREVCADSTGAYAPSRYLVTHNDTATVYVWDTEHVQPHQAKRCV